MNFAFVVVKGFVCILYVCILCPFLFNLFSQGQVMQPNQKKVIMSSSDLALQGISRNQAGNYSCTASNVEGDGDSNVVQLKVMCKYTC